VEKGRVREHKKGKTVEKKEKTVHLKPKVPILGKEEESRRISRKGERGGKR